jgi:LPXTG-site transpeptidase (sortase) family protein
VPDQPSPGRDRRRQAPLVPGLLVGSTDTEILRCYVDLVRSWRGLRWRALGRPLRLRAADVTVLVAILGSDSAEIERRLVAATSCTPRAARRGRRVLAAGVGALAVGMVTASSIADRSMVDDIPPTSVPTVALAEVIDVDGLQRSLGRVDHTQAMVQPPEEAPPIEELPTVEPPPVPAVGPLPAGTEALVTIASIGIERPVVAGGQSVIDQGMVAHYDAPGWEPPVAAGAPGTYWLAAHRTTHGEPFAALPRLSIGAEIRVSAGSHTFVYTVTSMQVTGLYPGDEIVYGIDPTAAVILLQTCVDADRRLLVHGVLTATRHS